MLTATNRRKTHSSRSARLPLSGERPRGSTARATSAKPWVLVQEKYRLDHALVLELFIYAQVALQDVELVVTCKDAGGRPCKLPMACMSFIENSVDRREKCCIETIINSFDINVCSVAMRLRGDGDHEYVVSDEDAAAIKSKTMWLRSSYYRQPDQARVEKYRSRGFTLVADPAIP